MNPNATWTRPDPAEENDEQFVAKFLERLGMKAVDKSAVVLDLGPTSFNAEAAVRILRGAADGDLVNAPRSLVQWIADQIEAQTRPPKPAEPLGLGAVVEDAEGRRWTQVGVRCWVGNGRGLTGFGWGEIDAVRVLSEGVSDA